MLYTKRRSYRQKTRGLNIRPIRQLSLTAIGHVIEKDLLRDGKGHIYQWDPRYINRDVESECQKQESFNLKFGLCFVPEKTSPMFTILGMQINISKGNR